MNVDDMKVVDLFEETVARYCGSKYGVAVSSNTNGIFLCLEMLKHKGELKEGDVVSIPNHTYMSVPMSILNAGLKVRFYYHPWFNTYQLVCTPIWDSAVWFEKDMYKAGSLMVLSFQYKKCIPIGRGGMILTDDKVFYDFLCKIRFNGRSVGVSQKDDIYVLKGWNMYMIPEQAARGLTLLNNIKNDKDNIPVGFDSYPDLSEQFKMEGVV